MARDSTKLRLTRFVASVATLAMFSCCGGATRPPTDAVAAAPSTTEEETVPTEFDLRSFVCELSGQRVLPEERAQAREIIGRELRHIGLVPQEHVYGDGRAVYYPQPEFTPATGNLHGVNLYAELSATVTTNDWLVVGAHYDTFEGTPGADDNASGVAAVLLTAHRLVRLSERRMNVMFAFFDQEEQMLVGSERFALMLSASGRRIVTVHNIDMVGWDSDRNRRTVLMHGVFRDSPLDDRYMRLYGNSIMFMSAEPDREIVPNGIVRENTNRGEHTSFEMHGIDAVTLIEETPEHGDFNPYYHGRGDTCERLDYDFLRICADIVTTAVSEQLR